MSRKEKIRLELVAAAIAAVRELPGAECFLVGGDGYDCVGAAADLVCQLCRRVRFHDPDAALQPEGTDD